MFIKMISRKQSTRQTGKRYLSFFLWKKNRKWK